MRYRFHARPRVAGTLLAVQRRAAVIGLCLPLFAVSAAACANKPAGARTQLAAIPSEVRNLDQFEDGYNEFVRIPEGRPERDAHRAALMQYLLGYLDRALKDEDEDEGLSALQYAVALYTPAELRTADASPGLAQRAHALYRIAARRGAENPSFLSLAVEQRFGDEKARKDAVTNWKLVEQWLVRNGPYATEPTLRDEELERSLEHVAAVFPSPFVVERLADLYVARYKGAAKLRESGRATSSASVRRMQITGYLLMRLYLRADDFEGAVEAMNRVDLDMPVAKLREMMVDAIKPRRTPMPLLALAEQFVPEGDDNDAEPYVIQGWGIVDNLSRRAVTRHPKDAYAHLLRARSLSHAGLTAAATEHLRRTIDLKEDIFEAWQALAQLEQQRLQALAEDRPKAALQHLSRVEAMHARAVKLWTDRPIVPGMPEAFYTVAQGLYQAGDVDKARKLLERSLEVQPVPDSLDLLGTIALKRSKLGEAKDHYENLANLSYDSKLAQLRWEARARQQLGEIALREQDAEGSSRHLKIALRHTNDLLANGVMDPDERSDRHVERGKLFFQLGDVHLAMEDFRKAMELSPQNTKVYADPLRHIVAHGYYEEARTIFRRAMAANGLSTSLKLYFALWLNEMALRRGETPDQEATEFLRKYKGDRWGKLLAKHARGKMEYDALLHAAHGAGEEAEAHFYEGLRRWREGDADGGKKLMRLVLDSEMMGFFEFDMAQAYLQWGDIPRTARPALPTTRRAGR
jgi:tetratricopeptide (TPR) repeat protein